MELAVRWNQRSTPADPRFLIVDVPGRTLKHCQVDHVQGKTVQWREISKNSRVPQFRAFDWDFIHNVVAVGQWSGEVAVLGLQNDAPSLSISVKTPRNCNSVAFSSESLLATGLDRVRNDYCLNVYDIGQWAGSVPDSLPPRQPVNEPLRRLSVSEGITSIKFFLQQPKILVTGVKGVGVRIYDLRDSQNSPAIQYSTLCVHNIAIDPCNANYFASAGPPKNATVQIWDRRSTTRQSTSMTSHNSTTDTPLLELKHVFESHPSADLPSIWSLRYSIAKQGSLGILGSHGAVRIFETKRDWVDSEPGDTIDIGDSVSSISVTRTEMLGVSQNADGNDRGAHTKTKKVLAFDFLNMVGSDGRPAAITMHGSQEIELRQLHTLSPAIATRFTSRASIAIADAGRNSQTGMRVFNASQNGTIRDALTALNQRLQSHTLASSADEQNNENENDGWMEQTTRPNTPIDSTSRSRSGRRSSRVHPLGTVEDALTIAERARRRCLEGYLLDPQRNAEIVQGNRELQLMWKWIGVAKEHANSGDLARGSINCNYLGVLNIWQNDIGSDISARARPGVSREDVWKRIIEQVKDLEIPKIEIPETDRAYHRWLCLYILGFDPTPDVLLQKVKSLALAGNNYEAALHALLARDPGLASIALRSGPRNSQNKALSLLLSIYAAAEDRSSLLEQLSLVTGSLKDPFVQAISLLLNVRISNIEASSLPAIPLLPPQHHIALAFSLLSDGPLESYLLEQYRDAVAAGLVSYIPLTGLSQLSLRIFKRYLNHTGDLQSVVLALSHVCPLYINKPRMMSWRSEYRTSLNRYGQYIKRAQFDMQTTKLATRPDGTTSLEPQKRQISLQCTNCNGALHRDPDPFLSKVPTLQSSLSDSIIPTINNNSIPPPSSSDTISTSLTVEPATGTRTSGFRTPTSPHSTTTTTGPRSQQQANRLFSTPRDGTLCPHCGARLPRCAVCEFWTGETDPRSRGARSNNTVTAGGGGGGSGSDGNGTSKNGDVDDGKEGGESGKKKKRENEDENEDEREDEDGNETRNGKDIDTLLSGFIEICLSCRHVYHRAHARAWFARHAECAAVGCGCVCAGEE